MAKKKRQGECAYCGEYGKLSKDHVVPQCLFVGDLPGDIPKVYACTTCNNIVKSGNDTYLRDALLLDMDNAQHPIVQQLWEKFARAVRRNQSEFANDALQKSQLVALRTPSGLFAGLAYELELAPGRTTSILSMMVRGLYQFYVGATLPQDTLIDVFRVRGDVRPFETTIQTLLQSGAPYIRVGDGQVFGCIYAYAHDRPETSLWFLFFYQRIIFGVATNRQVAQRPSA